MSRTPRNARRRRVRSQEGVGEVLDLVLGEPAHGGACVARDADNRVVFVRHGLPGEHVLARVTSTRHSLAWADVVDVLTPSPDRVTFVWPQAGPGGVGGGELAHVAPPAQRRWKAEVLRTQLRRIGGEPLAGRVGELGGVEVRPALGDEGEGDPLLHRRTRIELVVDDRGRPGMHRYRGSEVIALDDMPLAVTPIVDLDLFSPDSPWRDLWAPGERVRAVSSTGGDTVVVTPRGVFGPDRAPRDGDALDWEVAGEHFRVRPGGFWQTHVRGAEVLAGAVGRAGAVTPGQTVMELYSGAGLFTRGLGRDVGGEGRVVSLEGEEFAVADAASNLEGMTWVDIFVGGVDASGVEDLSRELGRRPDLVVLDPPRSGAGTEVCRELVAVGAPRLVLVACDPAAGARDLRTLTEGGYGLESFEAWDLFPHTHHVEFVATLTR